MEALCAWVKNLVFYLIFMTFVTNLLPGKAYDRYFRLFTGMVLILLVLSPLTGSLNLDDRLACYFESISFQSEAGEYRGEIEEMDRKRLERLKETGVTEEEFNEMMKNRRLSIPLEPDKRPLHRKGNSGSSLLSPPKKRRTRDTGFTLKKKRRWRR